MQQVEIYAGLGPEGEDLRARRHVEEEQQVDAELDRVAGALPPDVEDPIRVPHSLQHRKVPLEGLPLAADEDLEGPFPRPRDPSGDGRIEHRKVCRAGRVYDPPGGGDIAGAHVYPDAAGAHGRERSFGAEHRRFDLGRTGQHGHEHVRPLRGFGRRPRGGRASASKPLYGFSICVVGADRETGGQQTGGHGVAHPPQPHETGAHQDPTLRSPLETPASRSFVTVRS